MKTVVTIGLTIILIILLAGVVFAVEPIEERGYEDRSATEEVVELRDAARTTIQYYQDAYDSTALRMDSFYIESDTKI